MKEWRVEREGSFVVINPYRIWLKHMNVLLDVYMCDIFNHR